MVTAIFARLFEDFNINLIHSHPTLYPSLDLDKLQFILKYFHYCLQTFLSLHTLSYPFPQDTSIKKRDCLLFDYFYITIPNHASTSNVKSAAATASYTIAKHNCSERILGCGHECQEIRVKEAGNIGIVPIGRHSGEQWRGRWLLSRDGGHLMLLWSRGMLGLWGMLTQLCLHPTSDVTACMLT